MYGHILGLLCGHDDPAHRSREGAKVKRGENIFLLRHIKEELVLNEKQMVVLIPSVLTQVMKMMGLNNAVHWVAWFITGFVQLSISVTALTAILKYGKVLLHSDPFIIWLFLTVYAIATIMFWYWIELYPFVYCILVDCGVCLSQEGH